MQFLALERVGQAETDYDCMWLPRVGHISFINQDYLLILGLALTVTRVDNIAAIIHDNVVECKDHC
jgi:hypothetical protein